MRLHDEEPQFVVAELVRVGDLLGRLLALALMRGGPFLLAIDGRSSNGKTSLASRLAAQFPGAAIVHTDDVAWRHSRFGWDDLLLGGIIGPLRSRAHVSYRPPAWDAHDRPGAVAVPTDAPLVIIEGVGSERRSLQDELDAVIWVQTGRRPRRRQYRAGVPPRPRRRLTITGRNAIAPLFAGGACS